MAGGLGGQVEVDEWGWPGPGRAGGASWMGAARTGGTGPGPRIIVTIPGLRPPPGAWLQGAGDRSRPDPWSPQSGRRPGPQGTGAGRPQSVPRSHTVRAPRARRRQAGLAPTQAADRRGSGAQRWVFQAGRVWATLMVKHPQCVGSDGQGN